MGDDPTEYPRVHQCSNSRWDGDLLPDFIVLTFAEIEKGASWNPSWGDTLQGAFEIPFSGCSLFTNSPGPPHIDFWRYVNKYVIVGRNPYGILNFRADIDIYEESPIDNQYGGPELNCYGGNCIMELFYDTPATKASWTAADLVGVPKSPGYLAEGLPPTQYSRFDRYVNNANGTNIKIIGDY